MISVERMRYVHNLVKKVGIDEACQTLDLPRITVVDYLGRYAQQSEIPKANILLFDIETAPMLAYIWSLRQKYIPVDAIKEDWFIICWTAKWLFGDEVFGDTVTQKEAIVGDDKRVVKSLWNAIDEADVIIAHNLIGFDIRKANSRFIKHGLNPPCSYQMIDTYKVASKEFGMTKNSLDYLCRYLGIPAKLPTRLDLWKRVKAGDKQAIEEMYGYCENDSAILEDVYLRLRPWIKSHPNVALYLEGREGKCASCGSSNLAETKPYFTPTGEYKAYRCDNCGAFTRSRHSKKRNEKLLRSVAR